MPQSEAAANPRHQEEEKKTKHCMQDKQSNAREADKLCPKRCDHNAVNETEKHEKKKQCECNLFKSATCVKAPVSDIPDEYDYEWLLVVKGCLGFPSLIDAGGVDPDRPYICLTLMTEFLAEP